MTKKQINHKTSALPAVPYEPTPREKAALDAVQDRKRACPPSPRLKVTKEGKGSRIGFDHPHLPTGGILALHAVGTTSGDFLDGLVRQLANATSQKGEPDEDSLNFMFSIVKSVQPKDEIEAMLAAQMAAVHMATMTFARRLAHVETLPQQDGAERGFNKLARTFATQMEALKRYRTGGQQKVIVEHVTVQAGGQAIVGHVSHPGGGNRGNEGSTS